MPEPFYFVGYHPATTDNKVAGGLPFVTLAVGLG